MVDVELAEAAVELVAILLGRPPRMPRIRRV